MFNADEIVEKYGISGIFMPYFWLIVYIFFHYEWIGFWFNDPTILSYVGLIIHIILTINAIVFSHYVLMWAAKKDEYGKVFGAFAGIIRKMADAPMELIKFIGRPINQAETTLEKVLGVITNLLYVLISVFFGYVVFNMLAILFAASYIAKKSKKSTGK